MYEKEMKQLDFIPFCIYVAFNILNIKCELTFQTKKWSRSGAQFVRRRQNKSSAILVAIIVVFLICHIHRLVFRIYELAHPEKSLYKHYLKCETFCHFIFSILLFGKKRFALDKKFQQNASKFVKFHVCMFKKILVMLFFHFPFHAILLSPL